MDKVQNMLLGIGVGDAYGACYEFAFKDRKEYQTASFEEYVKHSREDFMTVNPGSYTDDTQMSIAVAELLLSNKKFNRENLAESFVECYKRDPILGYAGGFQRFLNSVNSGKEFLEKIKPISERNGAAMRSVPIGLARTPKQVIDYAKVNASLTHAIPKGVASSVAISLMSHYNLYRGGIKNLNSQILSEIEKIDLESFEYLKKVSKMKGLDAKLLFGEKYEKKGVPCDGMRTVGAVIHILSNYSNARDVLLESVKLGGDTDSTASIALGIFSINNSLDNLPKFLFQDFEITKEKYGKDYLLNLGEKLNNKFLKESADN